jgi:hypothetical protein
MRDRAALMVCLASNTAYTLSAGRMILPWKRKMMCAGYRWLREE